MIKPIIKYPDTLLKQMSLDIVDDKWHMRFNPIETIAEDLVDTMLSENALGLSAPQIGMLDRVIAIMAVQYGSTKPSPLVMVNPVIMGKEGSKVETVEGCLSFPNYTQNVKRPSIIVVEYLTTEGQRMSAMFNGVEAIVIQHEIDHLNGIVFIDHLSPLKKSLVHAKLTKRKKNGQIKL